MMPRELLQASRRSTLAWRSSPSDPKASQEVKVLSPHAIVSLTFRYFTTGDNDWFSYREDD